MVKKVSKELIWGSYAVLIIVLGVVGYFIGRKNKKGAIYASIGVIVGVLISVNLWITVGRKLSEGNK